MRKTLAVLTATLALTFGTASVAAAAIGSDSQVAVAAADDDVNDDDDKTGLWGLVGLLGLAGLAGLRRRPTPVVYDSTRNPNPNPGL